jgi:hypothetical protein
MGDDADALAFVDAGLEQARTMPSPCYEATSLWLRSRIDRSQGHPEEADADRRQAEAVARRVGAVLPDTEPDGEPVGAAAGERAGARGAPPSRASLAHAGATWTITSPLGGGVVAHSVGIDQLARVLAAAPGEVLAVDLVAGDGGPVATLLGPPSTRSPSTYRRRIAELQAEIDEADGFHDPERAEQARRELDALMQELRRAVGLRGRDRPVAVAPSGPGQRGPQPAPGHQRRPPGRARPGRPPRGVRPHRPGLRPTPPILSPGSNGRCSGTEEHRRRNIVPCAGTPRRA